MSHQLLANVRLEEEDIPPGVYSNQVKSKTIAQKSPREASLLLHLLLV